jgi:hypothetical protein
MMKPTRMIVSIVLVASMAMSLISALIFGSKLLVIIFTAIQFCSLVWYVLSYIPYGRQMCTNCLKSCCCGAGEGDDKSESII